nr:uncharacterized protein I203_01285 [Kwoniella mangroviensis CBS 8507]OCF69428.1 hypothetical protein I203_01285 [Kwoniella mangroviensis CBS 8507]
MAEASTSQSPIQQIHQLQHPEQQSQQQQQQQISPQPTTPLHPFQCTVCLRRFTRHENLKRHAHRHRKPEEEVKYACNHCNKVFARSDLRRRHIRKKHPEFAPSPLPSQRSNSQSNIIARLSNSAITFSSSSVAATVDHHLRWFLTYLDKTQDVTKEAPWMAIYSFKAVLIAYQQVSSGNNDPLNTLGLSNSDDMLEWIKGIFEKRSYWSVGKIVLDILGELDHDD